MVLSFVAFVWPIVLAGIGIFLFVRYSIQLLQLYSSCSMYLNDYIPNIRLPPFFSFFLCSRMTVFRDWKIKLDF